MKRLELTVLAVIAAASLIAPATLLAGESGGQSGFASEGNPSYAAGRLGGDAAGVATTSIATPATASAARASRKAGAKSSSAANVTIGDFFFKPKDVTVNVGDAVTWTNTGKVPEGHTVTGDGFDSGVLKSGATYAHRFATAGSFDYVCTLHPNMRGTVTVMASSSSSSGGGGEGQSSGGGASSSGTGGISGASNASGSGDAGSGGSGSLPLTGLNLILLGEIGIGLIAAGLLIRRLVYR